MNDGDLKSLEPLRQSLRNVSKNISLSDTYQLDTEWTAKFDVKDALQNYKGRAQDFSV